MAPSATLLKAIAVTAEITQTDYSPAAAKVIAMDLADYPEPAVLKALTRCRRELRGRMSLQDILERIDDGRPGPEEAWAMVPKDEAASVVWTDEMAEAMRIAVELMDSPVQARMAFLEKYRVLVREAREARKPPKWWASLGHDPHGRERALLEAVERGRLPQARALELLPNTTPVDVLRRIAEMKPAMLEAR